MLIADIAQEYEVLVHFAPTAKQRQQFARSGAAMPDGSFYIRNASDLDNAIRAVGRATPNAGESEEARRNAVRRHIIRRARFLKLSDRIPDTWNPDGSLKQSAMTLADEVEDWLAHYGVLGMKWGVRNRSRTTSTPRHPVSPDAATALALKGQVRKHGTQSLSNADLQKLVTRLNLERQYSNLNPDQISAGRAFMHKALVDAGKQEATALITQFANAGAKWLIKKGEERFKKP